MMLNEDNLQYQIYNNPKKERAYFKPLKNAGKNKKNDRTIWSVLYDENKKEVNKIY